MTNSSVSLYQGTSATPGSGLVVGQQNGNQVSQVRVIEFTGGAVQSVTNPVGGTALITITASATGTAAFLIFQSSATASGGQAFTDPNIGAYNGDPTLMILSVNGVILTPNVSYTINPQNLNQVIVSDFLDPLSVVQIEPNPGAPKSSIGFNFDNIPVFVPSGSTTQTAGAMGATSFVVAGDETAVFLQNLKVAFQSTRISGQLYTITSATFINGVTTVNFTPALLNVDVYALGSTVYLVMGSFSQTFVTDLTLGQGLQGVVNNGILTIETNSQDKLNFDTVPVFTNSDYNTIGSGFAGTTTFSVIGNAVSSFPPQGRIAFQNTRINGQIYTISTSTFTGSNTNVVFSPQLQAVDAFTDNTIIYFVTGTFTQTQFSSLATGYGLVSGVDATGLLTIATIPIVSALNFDSVPAYTSTNLSTVGPGAPASISFTVIGDAVNTFATGTRISFQNTRFTGQVYIVTATPVFSGGATTVLFSPALLNIDTYISGTLIYTVTGQFTQTPFSNVVPGVNITGQVTNGNFLTLNAPISVGVSGGATGLSFSNSPVTGQGTMTMSGVLNVASGGTGRATLDANSVLTGNALGGVNFVAPGAAGNVLTSTASGSGTIWNSTAPVVGALGGTWQNMSGSRSVNTTYTNSTSGVIAALISLVNCNGAQAYINGNLVWHEWYDVNTGAGQTGFGTALLILPPNATYSASAGNANTWWELRP